MCYQSGAPPTRLPDSLFESLVPWIRHANELLILGGETFIARECLAWIERITPSDFPTCRLAAITNGLGFTSSVCELILNRQWSWILVSIDAASAPVYRKVRGGDFDAVLAGLQSICDIRAVQPFELRLGFTLQMSNLQDAIDFVDLCADYDATPQFTVVAGDWHGESPTSSAEFDELVAILELVDKRLAECGFSEAIISSALASVRSYSEFWNSPNRLDLPRGMVLKKHIGESLVRRWPKFTMTRSGSKIRLEITGELETSLRQIAISQIEAQRVDSLTVNIPFFRGKTPISALDVTNTVEWLLDTSKRMSWEPLVSQVDLTELGLNPNDCFPSQELIAHFGRPKAADFAVVSPVFNRATMLPLFLASTLPQLGSGDELILVDDGSTDGSIEIALECIRKFPGTLNVTVIGLRRQERYEKGTFTFGAGVARQAAVANSNAKMLAFIDPDQLVDKDCLKQHRFFLEHGFDVVMGDRRELDLDIDTEWRSLRNLAMCTRKNWWMSFCTANVSVGRRIFDSVGGFDPTMQYWGLDDTDLGFRLFAAGARAWHTLRSAVVHLDPEGSGAGETDEERLQSYRLHMEVLFRKYLTSSILDSFEFLQ
jgi:GT2 family glycosyltransferase